MSSRTDILMSTYKPELAIIVHKGSADRTDFYLESHVINEHGQLLEGKPLQQDTIQEMVDVFFDERQNQISVGGFMPSNILSFDVAHGGNYKMVWYRTEEERFLHFASQLKISSGKAWVPALVYKVDRRSLTVVAVKTNQRPVLKTKLFRPPFHNVSDLGSVCLGSAKVAKPKHNTYDSLMKYWEDLFWLSEFSHLNGASNPTKSPLENVWKKLIKSKKTKWSDIDELVPLKNYTLNALY